MIVRLASAIVLVCGGFLHSARADAQEAAEAAARPTHSIEIAAGEAATIAYWRKLSDRSDLGVRTGLTLRFVDGDTEGVIAFGPALRRYWAAPRQLAPYTQAGIDFLYNFPVSDLGAELRAGIGLDWFPVRSLSLGGHVGLAVLYQHVDGGAGSDVDAFTFQTFNSGILLRLYF